MELRLPLEMSPGREAACRAVFGTWVFFQTMHGKLPLLVDFIHRVEFREVSGHRVLIKRGPGNRGPTQNMSSRLLSLLPSVNNHAVLCLVAESCLTLCNPMDSSPPGSSVHGDSPGKNAEVGNLSLLQGIFPTQGKKSLPHCRWILYHLSNQGSP